MAFFKDSVTQQRLRDGQAIQHCQRIQRAGLPTLQSSGILEHEASHFPFVSLQRLERCLQVIIKKPQKKEGLENILDEASISLSLSLSIARSLALHFICKGAVVEATAACALTLFILMEPSFTSSSARTMQTVSFFRFPFTKTVSPRKRSSSSILSWDSETTELSSLSAFSTTSRYGLAFRRRMAVATSSGSCLAALRWRGRRQEGTEEGGSAENPQKKKETIPSQVVWCATRLQASVRGRSVRGGGNHANTLQGKGCSLRIFRAAPRGCQRTACGARCELLGILEGFHKVVCTWQSWVKETLFFFICARHIRLAPKESAAAAAAVVYASEPHGCSARFAQPVIHVHSALMSRAAMCTNGAARMDEKNCSKEKCAFHSRHPQKEVRWQAACSCVATADARATPIARKLACRATKSARSTVPR